MNWKTLLARTLPFTAFSYFAFFGILNGCVERIYTPATNGSYVGYLENGNSIQVAFINDNKHILIVETTKDSKLVACAQTTYNIHRWDWWGWRIYMKYSHPAETSRYGDGWLGLHRLRLRPFAATPTSLDLHILYKIDERNDQDALFGKSIPGEWLNMDIDFYDNFLETSNGKLTFKEMNKEAWEGVIELDQTLTRRRVQED